MHFKLYGSENDTDQIIMYLLLPIPGVYITWPIIVGGTAALYWISISIKSYIFTIKQCVFNS